MNCNLPKITYPRFRLLLLLKFHEAICLEGDVAVAKRSIDSSIKYAYDANSRILNAKDILKRVKKSTSVAVYRSSIALKLAAQTQRDVTEVALKIADFYRVSGINSPKGNTGVIQEILSDLTVRLLRGGFLEFEFGERAIAAWLQELVRLPHLDLLEGRARHNLTENLNCKTVQNGQPNIFFCQYTYARCHSLLRMADESPELSSVVQSKVVPWLTEAGQLRVMTPCDRALLSQLVTTLDEVGSAQDCLKLSTSLSQAFQEFYRGSQIFGEIRVDNPQLAQCRLGLVMITHSLLRSLLQQGLGVPAPETL